MKSLTQHIKENLEEVNESFDHSLYEGKITSDSSFKEYAEKVLKFAHGSNFDQGKATDTIKGILDMANGDYGAAVGILQNAIGED